MRRKTRKRMVLTSQRRWITVGTEPLDLHTKQMFSEHFISSDSEESLLWAGLRLKELVLAHCSFT